MLPTERGRALDAAVAVEVMGWKCARWEAYHYHSSPAFARDVEAEIERRGLVDEYVRNLRRVLYAAHGDDDTMPQLWRFATATPEQRCLAALAALRGGAK